jgi:hypothetical protein
MQRGGHLPYDTGCGRSGKVPNFNDADWGAGCGADRQSAIPKFPGLFAAGEVTNFWHPCVTTAYAHGVQVAKSIQITLQTSSTAVASMQNALAPSLVIASAT